MEMLWQCCSSEDVLNGITDVDFKPTEVCILLFYGLSTAPMLSFISVCWVVGKQIQFYF